MSAVKRGNVKDDISDGANYEAIPRNDNGVDAKCVSSSFQPKAKNLHDESEVCDCTRDNCVGCFFPCEKCSSVKCGGTVCHKNRPVGRYMVEKE